MSESSAPPPSSSVSPITSNVAWCVGSKRAVDSGLCAVSMRIDEIDGGLVSALIGHGAKGMAKSVEVAMAVDAELVEQFPHLLGDWPALALLGPAIAILRDEHQPGV